MMDEQGCSNYRTKAKFVRYIKVFIFPTLRYKAYIVHILYKF
jgi:hypothetical protein